MPFRGRTLGVEESADWKEGGAISERLFDELKTKAGIKRQIKLPLRQSLRMTKNSIFIRLGRSVITSLGIFLGVAFMCSVLTSSAVMAGASKLPDFTLAIKADPSVAARNIWTVVMALLVATVGIINAMLMAVTERYKEIGTMKCLGALDSFVVKLFVLESGMLGFLGALAGAIVGTGFAILLSAAKFGWAAVGATGPALTIRHHPISLIWALIGATLLGTILAVLAAIYPAWRAARMPAAAALRVEV